MNMKIFWKKKRNLKINWEISMFRSTTLVFDHHETGQKMFRSTTLVFKHRLLLGIDWAKKLPPPLSIDTKKIEKFFNFFSSSFRTLRVSLTSHYHHHHPLLSVYTMDQMNMKSFWKKKRNLKINWEISKTNQWSLEMSFNESQCKNCSVVYDTRID